MYKSVLIVEDHPLFRNALVLLVQSVVGESSVDAVSSTEAGLSKIRADLGLIVLDLDLPGINGVAAIVAFQRRCPLVPIIVVSASQDRHLVNAALHSGAKAFISKSLTSEAIVDVVQRLLIGQTVDLKWQNQKGILKISDSSTIKITGRQQEILVLLSQGLSNKEMALRLNVAETTIKMHLSSLFKLLNVVNRTQAVLAGRRLGLSIADEDPKLEDATRH